MAKESLKMGALKSMADDSWDTIGQLGLLVGHSPVAVSTFGIKCSGRYAVVCMRDFGGH